MGCRRGRTGEFGCSRVARAESLCSSFLVYCGKLSGVLLIAFLRSTIIPARGAPRACYRLCHHRRGGSRLPDHLAGGEERGWSQCLAALFSAQKLNNLPEPTLCGITSNGRFWELGKLEDATFTREPLQFSLRNLARIIHGANNC